MLPYLTPDLQKPRVDVQQTTMAHDLLGRFVCNTWEEAIPNGGLPFDAVVIGSGMHGGYCAEKLYRFGEGVNLRVLVLEAGAFLVTTHLQNLPGIGLFAPSPATVTNNSNDPGPRNVVWGNPWHSNQGFPGLAYCVGGRSTFWGGWAPRLLDADLIQWPQAIQDYLRANDFAQYKDTEDEIGVTQPANHLKTIFGTTLQTALETAATPFGLKVEEAPLAVQSDPPRGALFSFDKYSTANLLISAIREDLSRRWTFNDNSRRRLLLVPRAHVTQLFTSGTTAVQRIALTVDGQPKTLTVGQELSPNCVVVLAAGTIESTRLALSSFPAPGMGANLMAHLRSDTTVRIKRSALGLGPMSGDLETAAILVRGEATVGAAKTARRFHLQVTAAPSPTNDTEGNLFTAIPDIDHLAQLRANQDPGWVVFIFRALGEMGADRSVVDPFANKDLGRSWVDLTRDADQQDENGQRRAWVNLVPTADDSQVWSQMEQASLKLAQALAGNDPTKIQYWDGSGWLGTPLTAVQRNGIGTTHHEAGTLWIGDDKTLNTIADAAGRLRNVDNVSVAGPALFPTIGSANPTLTALTLARKTSNAIVQRLTPTPSATFKSLYTGTLAGWQMAGAGGFTPMGDVIQSFGGLGLLWYTREEFGDFELMVDWRVFRNDGNSGVFIRFPALNSSNAATDWALAVSRGYEIQIDDSGFNSDTNKPGDPVRETGAIYSFQAPSSLASHKSGDWNTYRIRAQADKLNVWLNDKQVITDFVVDAVRPHKGHVGLQNHSGVTGPSIVQFRNIQIKGL